MIRVSLGQGTQTAPTGLPATCPPNLELSLCSRIVLLLPAWQTQLTHLALCPITSATFLPNVNLNLQEHARFLSAFKSPFASASWEAHVSRQPSEPSLYPGSSRPLLSPSWASRAFGSHHQIIYYLELLTNLFPGRVALAVSWDGSFGAGRTGTLHFSIFLQQLVQYYAWQSSEMLDGLTAISNFPSDPREGTQSPWTLMEAVDYQQFYYLK